MYTIVRVLHHLPQWRKQGGGGLGVQILQNILKLKK